VLVSAWLQVCNWTAGTPWLVTQECDITNGRQIGMNAITFVVGVLLTWSSIQEPLWGRLWQEAGDCLFVLKHVSFSWDLSVCPETCLFVPRPVCLSRDLSVCPKTCQFVLRSVSLSQDLSVRWKSMRVGGPGFGSSPAMGVCVSGSEGGDGTGSSSLCIFGLISWCIVWFILTRLYHVLVLAFVFLFVIKQIVAVT